jgi:hypothetical protein
MEPNLDQEYGTDGTFSRFIFRLFHLLIDGSPATTGIATISPRAATHHPRGGSRSHGFAPPSQAIENAALPHRIGFVSRFSSETFLAPIAPFSNPLSRPTTCMEAVTCQR